MVQAVPSSMLSLICALSVLRDRLVRCLRLKKSLRSPSGTRPLGGGAASEFAPAEAGAHQEQRRQGARLGLRYFWCVSAREWRPLRWGLTQMVGADLKRN